MILEIVCTDYGILPFIKATKAIFLLIQIIVPIIAIISLTKIFADAMRYSDDKTLKKTIEKTKNLFIALIIIFLIPTIVSVVMNLTSSSLNIAACWKAADNIKLDTNSKYININEKDNKSIVSNPDDYEKSKPKPVEKNNNSSSGNNNSSSKSNDKAGQPGLSDSGKVSYLTKNGKKWNLNSNVQYNLNQSACSDGTYLYVAFKGDDNHGLIAKFDINSRKLIKKSKVMDLGHANDMTYDFSRNKIFVTREETNDLSLSMINPNTLDGEVVKVKISKSLTTAIKAFNGIAYDSNRGQLLVRARYGNSQLVWVDNNFKAVKVLKVKKWLDIPTQGMEIMGNKVIYSQSIGQYRSSVTSYSKTTGKKVKGTTLGVHGELEGVFNHNGALYGITFDKSDSNKSLVYKIDSNCY